jgi:hypothetical protein
VVLRGIWVEAQTRAFEEGVTWGDALAATLEAEQRRLYADED